MIERTFTTKEEAEFIEVFNRLCEMSERLFKVRISRVLYDKEDRLASIRWNTICTSHGNVHFETDKAYKRRIYNILTDSIQETILKEIK